MGIFVFNSFQIKLIFQHPGYRIVLRIFLYPPMDGKIPPSIKVCEQSLRL